MNEFVNYGKRGVDLPPGCKDLIDLLRLPGEGRSPVVDLMNKAHPPAEGLADIENYLSRLLQSPSRRASVWIDCRTDLMILGLCYGKGILRAAAFVPRDRQQQVSAMLREAGIQPTQNDALEGPPFTRFFLFSLPADVVKTARIVTELLCEGYGLPEDVVLEFRYREKDGA